MTNLKRAIHNSDNLRLIQSTPPSDDPPLMMGEICELASGSPPLLIVDSDGDILTISWRDARGVTENTIPRALVRRPRSTE